MAERELIKMNGSFNGTEIFGRKFDTINIDFTGAPQRELVRVSKEEPEQIIGALGPEYGGLVISLADLHEAGCRHCANGHVIPAEMNAAN